MAYCVKLSREELGIYKSLNLSDSIINGAVALFNERNYRSDEDPLPTLSQLDEFIKSNKYGINTLASYQGKEASHLPLGHEALNPRLARETTIKIKIDGKYVEAKSIEQAIAMDFLHKLYKSKVVSKSLYNSVASLEGPFTLDKVVKELYNLTEGNKRVIDLMLEKDQVLKNSMDKVLSAVYAEDTGMKVTFIENMGEDLSIKFYSNPSIYPNNLLGMYEERFSEVLREPSLKIFEEASAEQQRALNIQIEEIERDNIDRVYTPAQRASRENFIAEMIITAVERDMKLPQNQGKSFAEMVNGKGINSYIEEARKTIYLGAEGIGKQSPEYRALINLMNNPEVDINNHVSGIEYNIFEALQQAEDVNDYLDLIEDIDANQEIKDKALETARYQQEEYQKVYDNFSELVKGIKTPLLKRRNVRLSSKREEVEDVTEEIIERGFDYSANEGHPIDTVSKRIRQLLNCLPLMEGNKIVRDDLGMTVYLSDSYTYPILQDALQGTRSYEAMREKLGNLSKKYSWVNSLIKRLDQPANYTPGKVNEYERLQNEFFSSFYKVKTSNEVYRYDQTPEGKVLKVIAVNDDSMAYRNYTEWAKTYMQGTLLSENSIYDSHGNIHKDKLEALEERVKELELKTKFAGGKYTEWETKFLNNTEDQEAIIDVLRSIGIAPDADTVFDPEKNQRIREMVEKKTTRPMVKFLQDLFSQINSFISESSEYVKAHADNKGVASINMFNQFRPIYFKIGHLIEPAIENTLTKAAFRNKGKLYSSYTNPTYVQTLLDKLAGIEVEDYEAMLEEEYLKDDFFKYNYVVQKLLTDPNSRNLIKYKEILEYDDKEFKEWSKGDKYTMQIHQFGSLNSNTAWYRIPLAGEIKRAGYYQFEKITDIDTLYSLFENLVHQEIERIREHDDWVKLTEAGEAIPVDTMLKVGNKFHYLPVLNTHRINGKTLLEEVSSLNSLFSDIELSDLVSSYVREVLPSIVSEEVQKIQEEGIKNPTSYLELFVLNDLYFRTQFTQLTVGDMANFKDIVDFQKRYKQVLSSTTRINAGDAVQHTLYINDEVVTSTIIPEIVDIVEERVKSKELTRAEADFIINSFENINATDGQAYRTIDGLKFIYEKSGQWTEEMENFKEKLDKAFLSDNPEGLSFRDTQNFFFNVIKPLVYGSSMVETGLKDTDGNPKYKRVNHQHKNSEALMLGILGFATTSPTMRAITKFARDNGIHVVEFKSAVKVGLQGVVNLLEKNVKDTIIEIQEQNENGEIETKEHSFKDYKTARATLADLLKSRKITPEEYQRVYAKITNTTEKEIEDKLIASTTNSDGTLNESVVHSIPYSSYGFQVNTPEHFYDSDVLIGTQFRKLIMANITPEQSYTVKTKDSKGQDLNITLTGQSILDTINNMVTENVFDKYKEVKAIFDDPIKLEALIQSEVGSNPRYGNEIAKFFNLINKSKNAMNPQLEFEMALEDPQNAKIVEAILSGISKNRINKMKVMGGSLIQTSNFTLSNKLQIKMKEDGKSIDYIPAYLPVYSEKLLEHFGDGNGDVSIEKIQKYAPELLDVIGYRIPTEGKHSMLPIKIVGFLPNFSGSSIVLPADITAMTGSDFDVDKLYIFRPYLEVEKYEVPNNNPNLTDKNGNVRKTFTKKNLRKVPYAGEEGFYEGRNDKENYAIRNNFLFDAYRSILTSPHSAGDVFDPSSFKSLSLEAKKAFLLGLDHDTLDSLLDSVGINAESYSYAYYDLVSRLTPEQIQDVISKYEASNTPFLSSTMHYFETQNSVGLDLVGISANANTFVPVSQQIKEGIKLKNPIIFNGVKYTGFGSMFTPEGKNMQRVIGQFVTAAVDNVKDPTLAYMKADTGNLGAIIAGAALGIPTYDLAVLSNLGMFADKRKITSVTPFSEYISLIERYKDVTLDKADVNLTRDDIKTLAFHIPFLKKEGINLEILDDYEAEKLYRALYKADLLEKRLIELGEAYRRIISFTKLDTFRGAAGPTAADTLIKYLKIKGDIAYLSSTESPIAFDANLLNPELSRSLTKQEIRDSLVNSNSPFYKAFFYFGMDSTFDYMSKYFNVLNPNFLPTVETLQYYGMPLDVKNINKAYEHFILYNLSDRNIMSKDLDAYMLQDIPLIFTQLTQKYPELKSYLLFRTMQLVDYGNYLTLDFINANELESQRRDQFTREWESLLDAGEKDPSKQDLSDFARNLYRYGLYRGMIGYSRDGINHLAPARLKKTFTDYNDVLSNMRSIIDSNRGSNGRFVYQFFANTSVLQDNPRIPLYSDEKLLDMLSSLNLRVKDANFNVDSFIVYEDDQAGVPPTVLKTQHGIFLQKPLSNYRYEYTRLPDYYSNSPFVRYSTSEDFPSYMLDGNIIHPEDDLKKMDESESTDYPIEDYSNDDDFTDFAVRNSNQEELDIISELIEKGKQSPRKDANGETSCITK